MLKKLTKKVAGSVLVLSVMAHSTLSLAADTTKPDYTGITNQVDFADVIIGIMAIAGAVAGLYVVVNGVKKLTTFLRGA